jgi:hypothetical protein
MKIKDLKVAIKDWFIKLDKKLFKFQVFFQKPFPIRKRWLSFIER